VTQTLRKLHCPLDFDENSMVTLDVACKIAAQNGASIHIMRVVAMPPHTTEMPSEALKPYPVWECDAKLKLDHLAGERISRGIRWETHTRTGFAAAEITAAAKDSNVDLIVMATHGRSRPALEHFFLGSVAERVVRSSVCPYEPRYLTLKNY
jgi:nucleotide-binding universal stress UspA family protein